MVMDEKWYVIVDETESIELPSKELAERVHRFLDGLDELSLNQIHISQNPPEIQHYDDYLYRDSDDYWEFNPQL